MPVSLPRTRWLAALVVCAAIVALWGPILKPAGQALILIADLYSEGLVGTNLATLITPAPRVRETSDVFGDAPMRVTEWRPGWGDRHPAILLVPGASPMGNDLPELRGFGATLARAGYLVFLPEFPFMKEGRIDASTADQIGDAFAAMRVLPHTRDRPAGAFGISVGGGLMLVAAGSEPGFDGAAFVSVLGAHYDLDTYAASYASRHQRLDGRLVPWGPTEDAQQRLPGAILHLTPPSSRDTVADILEGASYEEALARVQKLAPEARAAFDAVSPEAVWTAIEGPIYWLHDPEDGFVPLAEARAAAAASRESQMTLLVPRLIQHAEVRGERGEGPLFMARELWSLLTFAFAVLRVAG